MQLNFQKLSKSFQGKIVFQEISGKISEGERIGLTGSNGIGKTTLVRILAGRETQDDGQIDLQPALAKIAYAEQLEQFAPGETAYSEVLQAVKGGSAPQLRASLALERVGLSKALWQREAQNLSGGEKTKLSLCKVMAQDFELLILDEPTNHLDLESLGVLEEYVLSLDVPLLVISHDRYFLDRIATVIWELTPTALKVYPGNYTAYKRQKSIELAEQSRAYGKQQARIEQLKEEIQERNVWFQGAHKAAGQSDFYRAKAKKHANRAKAKKRELARIEENKLEKPKREVSPAFELISDRILAQKLPKYLIRVSGLTKSYGQRVVLNDLSFELARGDRIALLGQNGAGKSTFLKAIAGLESYQGTISVSPQVKLGYFSQELADLPMEKTILEEVTQTDAGEARLLLASLLFKGDAVEKKLSTLSMGERARVAFAKLILSGANVLLLDEVTNFLDLNSREKIQEALEAFAGSLLFVSHDRYFIDGLARKVAVLECSGLRIYDGNYSYYLEKSRQEQSQSADYRGLEAEINRLECRLAYLGGRLASCAVEEKERLDREFGEAALKLRECKAKLSK